jgi:hypothetical protein
LLGSSSHLLCLEEEEEEEEKEDEEEEKKEEEGWMEWSEDGRSSTQSKMNALFICCFVGAV